MDWESDDAIEFPRIAEEHRRTQIQKVQDRVPQNHGTQWFQQYLQRGNLLLHPHAIGLRLDSGGDPYSPILAQPLETFYSCASPLKDLQLPHLQSWTCSSWKPSQCHEFRLGGLSDPGQWDCPRAQNILEQGVAHGYDLPLVMSTRIGVELVNGLGSQPILLDQSPNKTRLGFPCYSALPDHIRASRV